MWAPSPAPSLAKREPEVASMTTIRIGGNAAGTPPTVADPPSLVAVLQAPPGLEGLDQGGGLSGMVVARASGQINIVTEQGVFVLRIVPGLLPGMRVTLTPERVEGGLVARLQWTQEAARQVEPPATTTSAAASTSGTEMDLPPPPIRRDVTLHLTATAPAAESAVGQRLPVRIIAPGVGTSGGGDAAIKSSSVRPTGPSFPFSDGGTVIQVIAIGESFGLRRAGQGRGHDPIREDI